VENNVYHFITDEVHRPKTPKYLSKEMYELYPDGQRYVEQEGAKKLYLINKNERFERNYIEYALIEEGVIVDIASGPHGGWIHGILNELPQNAALISTDACSFCIDNYSRYYSNKSYFYFDIDLDKPLPFKDDSVDVFTGVLMCNIPNYRGLLTEIARCLRPGGKAVFEEVFYSPDSKTFEYLLKENAVYASSEIYVDFCQSIGLDWVAVDVCKQMVGKMDPDDGLPLSDSDESYIKNIYLKKM
jgi:SAM-dependent methyltransferase